jgi:antitoxin component YwqK of YwqJK toxin-antitoxin module
LRLVLVVALCFLVAPFIQRRFDKPHLYGDHYASGKVKVLRAARRGPDGELVSDGPYVVYYENGRKEMAGQYADGVRDGVWQWWYPDGRKKAECRYVDGIGEFRSWYESGRPLHVGKYDNETRTGHWVEYFESGARSMEGSYRDDEQDGVWTYWKEGNPKPAFQIRWDRGKRVDPE